jgi:hypothetical protein
MHAPCRLRSELSSSGLRCGSLQYSPVPYRHEARVLELGDDGRWVEEIVGPPARTSLPGCAAREG